MGLLGSLFGGSKSTSKNSAYGDISSAFKPGLSTTANVFNYLAGELGGGFDQYKDKAGFNFALNQGSRNISGSAAMRGLLNSGTTSKALARFESELGNQFYNNYLDKMSGVVGLGNQQAGILSGAGQVSKGGHSRQRSASVLLPLRR
jgi:hypothetical protein